MKPEKNSEKDPSEIQKNDFIELEFIGKVKDGDIFDTNIKQEAVKINLNIETRPFIICIGQKMILPTIDDFLIGKSLGKYELELTPEKAFGDRKKQLIQTMSLSVFKNQQVQPQPGMMFNFDSMIGRISAVSGGRVIVDFNNPLAGKIVVYNLNAKKKITDLDEKIKTLINFFFRMPLQYKLEPQNSSAKFRNTKKSKIFGAPKTNSFRGFGSSKSIDFDSCQKLETSKTDVFDSAQKSKKISDISEARKSENNEDFLGNKKLTIEADKTLENFINLFKPKFKEILNLDLDIKSTKQEENKEEKPSETKQI